MMITEWAHLPNATHIDHVLASLKANPNEWAKTYDSKLATRYSLAYDLAESHLASMEMATAALDTALDIATSLASGGVSIRISTGAYDSVCDALIALFTYEDSAHLLDSSPEEIQLLVALGHPYAVLMLPAAIASQRIDSSPPACAIIKHDI